MSFTSAGEIYFERCYLREKTNENLIANQTKQIALQIRLK